MVKAYREYLVGKLKAAGIKSTVLTSMKKLTLSQESHIGAILNEGEAFERSGQKAVCQTGEVKQKRLKVFDRTTTFSVVIGDYDQEKCEEIFEIFMILIDKGININGNYSSIEIEEADWVEKDDSILKAQVAVQFKVKFKGGIYKDIQYAKLKELKIDHIEKVST